MTNKYAIYCDSLEDEQLLKDWIKKESDLEGYNDYNYRKLYFHFPANDYLGFQQNFHLYDVCLAKDGYIKINIKDFLKEYYMKELTELPKSWCVQNDGSQLFKDTVVKYYNKNTKSGIKCDGSSIGTYYGFMEIGQYGNTDRHKFDVELSLDQFIKLTTKNMKTRLLGLPVIKGEKHHLEAFCKDCEKFGHDSYISPTAYDVLVYNNRDISEILRSERSFKMLFIGPKSYANYSDTNLPIKEFQLPQDWSIALDFMKENMDRWLKIQEENKEPEFKIGDIVTIKLKPKNWDSGAGGQYPLDYKKPVTFPFTGKIENIVTDWKTSYNISGYGFSNDAKIEPATPQEIEEYNNKPKIFKMTSTSGNFELEVSKKGIYYRPEDKYLNVNDIEQMCLGFRINNGNLNDTNRDCYIITYETVKVGCKSGCKISEWKQVYDYYKSLQV